MYVLRRVDCLLQHIQDVDLMNTCYTSLQPIRWINLLCEDRGEEA
jgi:hypothetical protein